MHSLPTRLGSGLGMIALAAANVLPVACSTKTEDTAATSTDAGDPAEAAPASTGDAGAEAAGGFVPADHALPPPLTLHSDKVFAAPQIVTVTFDGFALRDEAEQFGDFVVSSKWLDAVGKEYGVGKGTHLAKAHFAEAMPAQISDAQIVALLKAKVGAAELPKPSATNAEIVYVVYVAQSTKVDDGTGAIMCEGDYAGYHADETIDGTRFAYAVVPDCDGDVGSLTNTASHEIIEAATDTGEAWFLDVAKEHAWRGLQMAEVADLCEWADSVHEGGWAVQRSWSNAEAAAGRNPCVPVPPNTGDVMMGVAPAPAQAVTVAKGASTTFTLTGWSSAPVNDWHLFTVLTDGTDFDPEATLSAENINNGTTVTLTLKVPATDVYGDPVRRNQIGSVMIYSGKDADLFTPVTIVVE